MRKTGFGICLAYLLSLGSAFTALAGVTPELQHAIRENTFEVVMKKPEKDPVTYEKPLPLDLIPFIERTDAYRSVGTAFSLEEWQQRARALREAYVLERSAFVKNSRSAIPATVIFSPRASPCPPAATTTTGNAYPRVASDSRPLEKYWPFASKRLGEEGTVIAALRIAPTGCATGMAIIGSSGSDMLDSTVLKYLESAEFIPAGTDGKPAESQVAVPIVFKLEQ